LYVAGVDDPRHMHEPASSAHLGPGVTRSQQDAPPQAFRILMSHRPQALDHAAPLGVDLVLAGHTHGFQLGFGGRSVFEPWMPGRYIWGRYQKGPTQLCTSAGIGLWFPFRLGCPPEAPVVVLEPA
jgi:predicted MPP superfamily phosphohydrolase